MNELIHIVISKTIVYRWWIIIACSLCVIISAIGINKINIDSDLRVFFSKDNPQLQQLEALEKTFTKSENVIFIIAPKNNDLFDRENLGVIKALTEAAWQVPFSIRVNSITNYQHTLANADELVVEDLVDDIGTLSDEDLIRKKQIALSEPALINHLVSKDSAVSVINIIINFTDKKPADVSSVTDYCRNLRDQFNRDHPDINFYLTGSVLFDAAFSEVGQHDMATLVPLMLCVLVITIGLSLRSFMATFLILVVIVMATGTAMGLAGWSGISINPASASAPTIILTLAVADSVHILTMMYRLIAQGMQRQLAIIESVKFNFQAVLLTSITTATGFLTMNYSDSPPFHDLGNIVAMGIVAAFFYSLFFLPALLSVLPLRIENKLNHRQLNYLRLLANFVIQYKNGILVLTLMMAIGLSYSATQNRLNDNWIKYFSENIKVRVATDYLEEHISGSDFIEYSVSSGKPHGISEPEFLNNLENYVQWLRNHPSVIHVITLTDLMKKLNKNLHGDDNNWYKLPEQKDLAAQYLLLYEMSLPYGLDLNNLINVDKSATRILVTVKNLGTKALRQLDKEAQSWLKTNTPNYMHTQGSGISIVWAYLSERNIINMLLAAFGALIVISAIMIIALRRLDIGVLSLLPNILPAFMAFGIWAVWSGEIGLGLSVVVSMTLGIVVDDSIHFISKYLRAREKSHMTSNEAIHHTFSTVGPAMWITTVALVAGFLVLTVSDYRMTADMGLLSAITVSIALVMDFLLLPVILLKISKNT